MGQREDAISDIIGPTIVLMGGELLDGVTVNVLIADLADYSVEDITTAAHRLRKKTGRFSLSALIEQMPGGYVGGNEAWSTFPKSEQETGVVTQAALSAWGAAQDIYDGGDKIAARSAFVEAYKRNVNEAPTRPVYIVSFGTDPDNRSRVINKGIDQGLISAGTYKSSLLDDDLIALENRNSNIIGLEDKTKTKYIAHNPQVERNNKKAEMLKRLVNGTITPEELEELEGKITNK